MNEELVMTLTLDVKARNERGDMHSIDVIIANSSVQLAAQFTMLLLRIQRGIHEIEMAVLKEKYQDDIPF